MRRFIIVVVSVAFAVSAPAQQVLQCVNPDVLNGLVFNGRAESRLSITREMPANSAGFRAPAGLSLIGSGARGTEFASTIVAYKTSQDQGSALANLLGFMSDEGWSREPAPQPPIATVTVAGAQPAATTLCRNGERRNVQVQEIGGVRYATIIGIPAIPARACGAPDPQQGFSSDPMAARSAASAMMPQFSLPESARNSGSSGDTAQSGNEVVSSLRITSPDSAESLTRLLGRQLQAQGWRGDAEWKGALNTGSTWLRSNTAGQKYWGTLEILSLGGGVYNVGFTLTFPRQ